MKIEAGKEITQNDINRKLFEEITKVGNEVVKLGKETREEMKEFNEKMDTRISKFEEKMDTRISKFEEKMDTRMMRFEDNINLKMNWQLGLFGLFLTGMLVMMGIITKIIPIASITP